MLLEAQVFLENCYWGGLTWSNGQEESPEERSERWGGYQKMRWYKIDNMYESDEMKKMWEIRELKEIRVWSVTWKENIPRDVAGQRSWTASRALLRAGTVSWWQ